MECAQTVLERMDDLEPTFILATAANNHALGAAARTDLRQLDWGRFLADGGEALQRFAGVDSIQGGLVFATPALEALDYFNDRNRADTRRACGSDGEELIGRVAFWRTEELGACDPERVMVQDEVSVLDSHLLANNKQLKAWAKQNHYVFVDAHKVFLCIYLDHRLERARELTVEELAELQGAFDEAGCTQLYETRDQAPVSIEQLRNVVRSDTQAPLVSPIIPRDQPGLPHAHVGVFGLDGVHPNRLGHAMMATIMIQQLNAYYGLDLPEGGDHHGADQAPDGIWMWDELLADTLVQDPVPIKDQGYADVREYWSDSATSEDWRDLADLLLEHLAADDMSREGFVDAIDNVVDHDFRAVTEQLEPGRLKERCLDREDLQRLELRIRDHTGSDGEIDPCAVCCQPGQTQRCHGAADCPEVGQQ